MSYLIFDGVNLTDRFGLVISGAGTFTAPVRSVESLSLLGRNGNLIRDFGAYENLEVVYSGSGLKHEDIGNLDDLRAFLSVRQGGYYPLSDSYHPGEYRMARFMGPFAPELGASLRVAGFDLAFECKPQRFLLNGAQPMSFTAGVASSYIYHTIEDFAASFASSLTSLVYNAGYTVTEIPDLKFSVLPCDFSALYSSLGGDDAVVTFGLGWTLPYFYMVSDSDPINGSGFITTGGYSRKNMASELNGFNYLVQPYGFNAQVIVNGSVYAQDGLATGHPLLNPERAEAKPLVRLNVTNGAAYDNYAAGVNDCGIYLDGYAQGDTIQIDAETMNAVYLFSDGTENVTINANQLVSFSGDEITLKSGRNDIYTTDGVSVDILPRWCRL